MPRRAASSTDKSFKVPSYESALEEGAEAAASMMMREIDNAIDREGGLPSRYTIRKETLAYGADQSVLATSGLYTPMKSEEKCWLQGSYTNEELVNRIKNTPGGVFVDDDTIPMPPSIYAPNAQWLVNFAPKRDPMDGKIKHFIVDGKNTVGSQFKDCNLMFNVEDMHAYAQGTIDSKLEHEQQDTGPGVRYEDDIDMINDWKTSCTNARARFAWPGATPNVNHAIALGLNRCPPYRMMCIENQLRIPEFILREMRDTRDDANPVISVFHGTSPHSVPDILRNGFMPSAGAGAETLSTLWGAPICGCYFSEKPGTALTYPYMAKTDGKHYRPGQDKQGPVAGGFLMTNSGTLPIRVMFRCMVPKRFFLWRRGHDQCMYMPHHVHITHLFIIVLSPEMVNVNQTTAVPVRIPLQNFDLLSLIKHVRSKNTVQTCCLSTLEEELMYRANEYVKRCMREEYEDSDGWQRKRAVNPSDVDLNKINAELALEFCRVVSAYDDGPFQGKSVNVVEGYLETCLPIELVDKYKDWLAIQPLYDLSWYKEKSILSSRVVGYPAKVWCDYYARPKTLHNYVYKHAADRKAPMGKLQCPPGPRQYITTEIGKTYSSYYGSNEINVPAYDLLRELDDLNNEAMKNMKDENWSYKNMAHVKVFLPYHNIKDAVMIAEAAKRRDVRDLGIKPRHPVTKIYLGRMSESANEQSVKVTGKYKGKCEICYGPSPDGPICCHKCEESGGLIHNRVCCSFTSPIQHCENIERSSKARKSWKHGDEQSKKAAIVDNIKTGSRKTKIGLNAFLPCDMKGYGGSTPYEHPRYHVQGKIDPDREVPAPVLNENMNYEKGILCLDTRPPVRDVEADAHGKDVYDRALKVFSQAKATGSSASTGDVPWEVKEQVLGNMEKIRSGLGPVQSEENRPHLDRLQGIMMHGKKFVKAESKLDEPENAYVDYDFLSTDLPHGLTESNAAGVRWNELMLGTSVERRVAFAVTLLATRTSLGAFKVAREAGVILESPASIEDAASLPHRMMINAIVYSARLNKCEYNYCMEELKHSNAWAMGPRKKPRLKPLHEVAHDPEISDPETGVNKLLPWQVFDEAKWPIHVKDPNACYRLMDFRRGKPLVMFDPIKEAQLRADFEEDMSIAEALEGVEPKKIPPKRVIKPSIYDPNRDERHAAECELRRINDDRIVPTVKVLYWAEDYERKKIGWSAKFDRESFKDALTNQGVYEKLGPGFVEASVQERAEMLVHGAFDATGRLLDLTDVELTDAASRLEEFDPDADPVLVHTIALMQYLKPGSKMDSNVAAAINTVTRLHGFMSEGWSFAFNERGKPYYYQVGYPDSVTDVHPDDEGYVTDKMLDFVNPVNSEFAKEAEGKPLGRYEECDDKHRQAHDDTWTSGSNWNSGGTYWRDYSAKRYNQAYSDEQQLEHEVGWASDNEYRNEPWQPTSYTPHDDPQKWDGWKDWQNKHWKMVNAVADAATHVPKDAWKAENESAMWEAYSQKVTGEKKSEKYWTTQNEKHWNDVHHNGYSSSQSWSPYRYGEASYSSYYYH